MEGVADKISKALGFLDADAILAFYLIVCAAVVIAIIALRRNRLQGRTLLKILLPIDFSAFLLCGISGASFSAATLCLTALLLETALLYFISFLLKKYLFIAEPVCAKLPENIPMPPEDVCPPPIKQDSAFCRLVCEIKERLENSYGLEQLVMYITKKLDGGEYTDRQRAELNGYLCKAVRKIADTES